MSDTDLQRQHGQRLAHDIGFCARLAGQPCVPMSSYAADWREGWWEADTFLRRQERAAVFQGIA
jgi:hypothetical protein